VRELFAATQARQRPLRPQRASSQVVVTAEDSQNFLQYLTQESSLFPNAKPLLAQDADLRSLLRRCGGLAGALEQCQQLETRGSTVETLSQLAAVLDAGSGQVAGVPLHWQLQDWLASPGCRLVVRPGAEVAREQVQRLQAQCGSDTLPRLIAMNAAGARFETVEELVGAVCQSPPVDGGAGQEDVAEQGLSGPAEAEEEGEGAGLTLAQQAVLGYVLSDECGLFAAVIVDMNIQGRPLC
jgi:hypothetical protein